MTARVQGSGYANTVKMANDLSPKKTMLIIVIVVGCFAVLWPKVFYPMLVGSANQHIKPSPIDKTTGCCDVISEKDVNTIKIMSEICSTIIQQDGDVPLSSKEIIAKCRTVVLDTCGIDISAVLQQQVLLGHTTKQILDQVRSLNGSLCLKYNFGVAPWRLGVPHRVTVKVSSSSSIRQERPIHLRSEMVHPAFRERGRAIPQTHSSPPSRPTQPKVLPGRPGPIPAMRPTMGGAGHVVPPPKQSTGTMGLIMPIYTIGIVIFFTYTVMKIVFKKQPEALYPPVTPDPVFRKEVFESTRAHISSATTRDGKLGDAELDQLRRRLRETEMAMERIVEQMANVPLKMQDVVANGTVPKQAEDQPSVKVLGMEMTASCEGGKKWSRSDSPVLPTSHPPFVEKIEPPQEIFLEGSLPPQSHHLLVSDSATATETQKINTEEDPAVVLAGKMTLSVISLDSSENGTEESKGDERSSSNVSEDFEKIDKEQISFLPEEARNSNLLDNIESEIVDVAIMKAPEGETNLKNIEMISEIISEPGETEQDKNKVSIIETKPEKSVIEDIQDTESFITEQETLKTEENLSSQSNEHIDVPISSEEDIFKKLNEAITGLSRELKCDYSYGSIVEFSPSPKPHETDEIDEEDKEIEHATKIESSDITNIYSSKVNTEEFKNSDVVSKDEEVNVFIDENPVSVENRLSESVQDFSPSLDLPEHVSDKPIDTSEQSNVATESIIEKTEVTGLSANSKATTTPEAVEITLPAEMVEATRIIGNVEAAATVAEDDIKLDKTEVVDKEVDIAQKPSEVLFEAELESDSKDGGNEEQLEENEYEGEYEEEGDDGIDEEIVYAERLIDQVVRETAERVNGRSEEDSKNGTSNVGNELLEDENVDNSEGDEEEEIEEIIEYITDEEEEEEEIEPEHRNNVNHLNENPDST